MPDIDKAVAIIEDWKDSFVETGFMPDEDDFNHLIGVLREE